MDDFTKLDELLREFAGKSVPGCACAVARDGEIIYEGYYGYADIEEKKPVGPDSLYRLASMTKLVTYAILMMLFEHGQFQMHQPVSDFFPEWADKKKFINLPDGSLDVAPLNRPITVRDAVIMSCGLPYCFSPVGKDCQNPTTLAMSRAMEPLWEKGHYTLREVIRAVAEVPVEFEPGTRWLYGFGSELVAGIVEELTGMPLSTAMNDYIFNPLGMRETDTHFRGDMEERLVAMYGVMRDGFKKMPAENDRIYRPGPENELGRPLLMTNVRDFSKFMQMLACGGIYNGKRLLSEKTIEFMRTNCLRGEALDEFQKENNGYNSFYGYGYGVRTLLNYAPGCGSPGSFGWTGGYGTWCEADPDRRLSVVYMHNMLPNMEKEHHHRVRETVYSCVE